MTCRQRTVLRSLPALLAACLALFGCLPAQAHKASDAYLRLQPQGATLQMRWDIALRDLDRELDLDRNTDDQLSWGEVQGRWADLQRFALAGLQLAADGQPCRLDPASLGLPALSTHSDGRYAVLRGSWQCAAPVSHLRVDYRLFADSDPTHRGILRVMGADPAAPPLQTLVLSPTGGAQVLALPDTPALAPAAAPEAAPPSASAVALASPGAVPSAMTARLHAFAGFVADGIHHILIGTDHVLFLLSLLLPAVWRRAADASGALRWQAAPALRPALVQVLQVVTAFTVAHSITLALAALGIVEPPSRWVESIIAASVIAAALNNLWPVVSEARWKLTFVFGLVHGFGFAAALKDAGLSQGGLVAPLLGFNLGVELGQLGIVAVVLPLAWALRRTRLYRGAFAAGSGAIATVAAVWLVERAFDLQLISG